MTLSGPGQAGAATPSMPPTGLSPLAPSQAVPLAGPSAGLSGLLPLPASTGAPPSAVLVDVSAEEPTTLAPPATAVSSQGHRGALSSGRLSSVGSAGTAPGGKRLFFEAILAKFAFLLDVAASFPPDTEVCRNFTFSLIYIYIYICVCVCVCVFFALLRLMTTPISPLPHARAAALQQPDAAVPAPAIHTRERRVHRAGLLGAWACVCVLLHARPFIH
jgi:hypothetical protein